MKNLILPVAAAATFFSCTKKITSLPDATDSGANTFGAKVNGTLWGPRSAILPGAATLEASFAGGDSYLINARDLAHSPNETEFEIYLKDVVASGTYQLNQTTGKQPNQSASYGYYVERNVTPTHEWITNPITSGAVVITKVDKTNHILAGTFSFRGTDITGNGPVLDVTEGRFDVKIQ